MNPNWIFVVCLVLLGCAETAEDNHAEDSSGVPASATPSGVQDESRQDLSRITNRYGMTFCLVTIDATRADHKASYPRQSYYLQQTEFTSKPFQKYGEDTVTNWTDRVNMQFPSQWQEFADLADGLSAADPDFDYRLPSQKQWAFACKNGYDQTCALTVGGLTPDSTPLRPNKYGIKGLVNHDLECGNVPGQCFGQRYWHDWLYSSEDVPECICDHVTTGHPDSDDSLDEVFAGRFVLIPKAQNQE